MQTSISALLLIVALGLVAWYGWSHQPAPEGTPADVMGAYAYTCDGDVAFLMTPSSDMNSIRIEPAPGRAYPPMSVLARAEASSGARFQGNGFVFQGRGETVHLTFGSSTVACAPMQNSDEAPFNFGD